MTQPERGNGTAGRMSGGGEEWSLEIRVVGRSLGWLSSTDRLEWIEIARNNAWSSVGQQRALFGETEVADGGIPGADAGKSPRGRRSVD
jgi:hypothetical protein